MMIWFIIYSLVALILLPILAYTIGKHGRKLDDTESIILTGVASLWPITLTICLLITVISMANKRGLNQ